MIKTLYKKLLSEKKRNTLTELIHKLISPIYYGNTFYCNCCNKKFSTFLTKGNIPRSHAQCPFCGSLERTRVLEFYMQNELDIYSREHISILHIAPESVLFHKLNKLKNVTYIDGDIDPAYARHIIDITDIPFPENFFDYIICSHVLGHIPDESTAIQELHRVLKPNGKALIATVLGNTNTTIENPKITSPEEKLQRYGEVDLCRLHGKDFADRLKHNGFTVNEVDYRLHLPIDIQKKYSLGNGKREKLFVCTK
ncbi:MAG: class I SAM-dependent methyltransferase [Bacteroidales bacterium]